jgi:hypothetical protein
MRSLAIGAALLVGFSCGALAQGQDSKTRPSDQEFTSPQGPAPGSDGPVSASGNASGMQQRKDDKEVPNTAAVPDAPGPDSTATTSDRQSISPENDKTKQPQ